MRELDYTYRGGVERGTGRGYKWHNGYSETSEDGSTLYPWMTARECQADAKARGFKAVLQMDSKRGMIPAI